MDTQTRAGIDIYGRALRYAEVQRRGDRYRLLRLGVCEFDFDVVEAVLEGVPGRQEALSEALSDVFEGSTAARLYVALHPPSSYSFFAPLPVEVSDEARKQRLLRDAALLTRSRSPKPLRLTADPVYSETLGDGAAVEWYHVMALDERLHLRFDRILRLLPQTHHRMTLSMHAAANAVEHLEQADAAQPRTAAPFTFALGWYPTHVELTLCRHGRWYFSHYAGAAHPDDCGYFALALLRRLGLGASGVGRVFLYGGFEPPEAFGGLADLLGIAPEALNPLRLIDLDEQSMVTSDAVAAYAPCLGVTL